MNNDGLIDRFLNEWMPYATIPTQPASPMMKKGTELETRNLLLSKKVYITKHIAEMRPMHACNLFCHVMSTSYKAHRKKPG